MERRRRIFRRVFRMETRVRCTQTSAPTPIVCFGSSLIVRAVFFGRPPHGNLVLRVTAIRTPTEERYERRNSRTVYVAWMWETGPDTSLISCDGPAERCVPKSPGFAEPFLPGSGAEQDDGFPGTPDGSFDVDRAAGALRDVATREEAASFPHIQALAAGARPSLRELRDRWRALAAMTEDFGDRLRERSTYVT